MKIKYLLLLAACICILCIAVKAGADSVTWVSQSYTAYAKAGECCVFNEETSYGPPLPVSAYAFYGYDSGTPLGYLSAEANSSITSSVMSVGVVTDVALKAEAWASFTGTYTAANQYFIFSYDHSGWGFGFNVQDLTSSSSLYSYSGGGNSSDVFYIPTIVGHDIEVSFSMMISEQCCGNGASGDLSYAMSTSVVPEPISSILFVIGGTLLAGRNLLRRRGRL